jgi:hypothetical protein
MCEAEHLNFVVGVTYSLLLQLLNPLCEFGGAGTTQRLPLVHSFASPAEKCCYNAVNKPKDEWTKPTSSYAHLVALKLFSLVELTRKGIGNCYKTRSICQHQFWKSQQYLPRTLSLVMVDARW